MAPIPNIRHEKFARAYWKKPVAAEAYRAAGYKADNIRSVWTAASRLLRHVEVQSRIKELRRQMAARNRITVDSLVDELNEARALALVKGEPSSAITATMSKARLTGLLVDRKETGAPGSFGDAASEAKVLERVKAELGDEAAQALSLALARADRAQAEEELAQPAEPEIVEALAQVLVGRGPGDKLN